MVADTRASASRLRAAWIIERQLPGYGEAQMNSAAVGPLELGRDAVKRHAWTEALEAYAAADHEGGMTPDDLERMGEAAWWAGKPDEASDTLERAFTAYVEAGRPTDAAGAAFLLAYMFFRRQAPSIGAGWLGRAASLL